MVIKTNLTIIGAGIAGCTAAIYAKRAQIDFIIIENKTLGGKLNYISHIENYPGFKSIQGYKLAQNIKEQLNSLDIKITYDEVINIKQNKDLYEITTKKTKIITKYIIIATGSKPRKILPDQDKYLGKGLSYCAVCDGPFFKNKIVVTIGGGNSAIQESLYLAEIVKKLYLVHRRDKFRAESSLVEKLKAKNNVEFILNHQLKEIKANTNNKVNGVILENTINKTTTTINCDGIFCFIGYEPNTHFLNNLSGLLDEKGFIIVDYEFKTNYKNIWAAGDVTNFKYKQLATASAGAICSVLSITKELSNGQTS